MQRGDLESGEGLESAGSGGPDGQKFFGDTDVLLEELRTEGEEKQHSHSAGGS
jgi:hypothetical protein